MRFGGLGMRGWIWYGVAIAVLIAVAGLRGLPCAYGFPPYRMTDAETADPWTLEGRLGLIRTEHERPDTAYSSPLLRWNLGLPQNLELTSEFDYRPDEGWVTDAAIGLKWIPLMRSLSVGVETLALLSVSSPNNKGAGVDALLLATLRVNALHLHVNAGGFYDGRPAVAESGWKSGVILDVQLGLCDRA